MQKSINYPILRFKQLLFKNRLIFIGLILLSTMCLMAIIGPYISKYTYYDINLEQKNFPPSKKFLFGSDELGRDIFTRVCVGTRISLTIGTTAALIDVIFGAIFGAIAALSSKIVDEIMMRLCDIISTIPYLLTVILLIVFIGPGMCSIIVALTITGWINMARIIRAQVLSLKTLPFIEAAKIMGAAQTRIIFRHILPNCLNSILATMTISVPTAIFSEAFLSFLGLGIQAPIASLGTMVNDALNAIQFYPWRLFFPALFIFLIILAFNILAEGIRSSFNPKELQ